MAFFFQSKRTPPPPAPDGSLLHVPLRTLTTRALGVPVSVSYLAPGGDAQAADYEAAVRAALGAIEARYSTEAPGSLLSQLNASAGKAPVAVDPDAERVLDLCESLVFLSAGRVDPTVLPLIRLWKEGSDLPAADEIAAAKARVGWSRLRRSPGQAFLPDAGMGLDFGSFLYGMAAETIAVAAKERRIPCVLAQVGFVYRALGAAPGRTGWSVSPEGAGSSIELVNTALAVVGDGPGFTVGGRRFPSVIDLRSGWPVPPQSIRAMVVGPSAIKAPVIALAAFVQGPPEGITYIQSFSGFEGTIVTEANRGETRDWRHLTTPA